MDRKAINLALEVTGRRATEYDGNISTRWEGPQG